MNDLTELQQRTQLRAEGQPLGASVVRLVEEFPSLIADIGERSTKGEDNTSLVWLKKILRRGRKYGMGIVLVSQEFEVKSLGIAGEGNLRNAFTIVYLGKQALKQLDNVRDPKEREGLRAYLTSCKRPCLVEIGGLYQVADVPDLSTFAKELSDYQREPSEPSMPSTDTLDTLDAQPATPGSGSKPYGNHEGEALAIPANKGGGATLTLTEADQGEDLLMDGDEDNVLADADVMANIGYIEYGDGESITMFNARYLHKAIKEGRSAGQPKGVILKTNLRYSGRKYPSGRALWQALEERLGSFD